MNKHKRYTKVTKELLDSIIVGDSIKVNNWRNGLVVRGVSENYFVMANQLEDESWDYSVCEKKIRAFGDYNRMREGFFHVAMDNWIFGYLDGYHFDDPAWIKRYLATFENDESAGIHSKLSERSGIPILSISIRRA